MNASSLFMAGALLLAPLAATAQTDFADAVQDHRAGRWSSAYGRFARLASDGDADAARVALFMHRNGPLLYGTYWDASAEDLQVWTQLAASRQGRAEPIFHPLQYAQDKPATRTAAAPAPRVRMVAGTRADGARRLQH